MSALHEAAAAVTGDFITELQAATPGGPDDPVVEEVEQQPEEPVSLELGEPVPDEIEALLAEEPEPEPEPAEVEPEEPEYFSDESEKLRVELRRKEKRLAFLEEQQVKQNLSAWRQEAQKYFPFADADNLAGRSRREILARAKAEHEIAKRGAETVLSQVDKVVDERVKVQLAAEVEKAKAAWGTPTNGPGLPQVTAGEVADVQKEIASARTLQERIMLKLRHGQLSI